MPAIVSIDREKYIASPRPHVAAILGVQYTGSGLKRQERLSEESTSDWCENERIRYSEDNGRSWTEWLPNLEEHPKQGEYVIEELEFARAYDPHAGKMVRMLFQRVLQGDPGDALAAYWKGKRLYWDHMFWQVSEDNGETWGSKHQLMYQDGPAFDPDNWAADRYLDTNRMYGGYNIQPLSNGSIAYSGTAPASIRNEDGVTEDVDAVICMCGRWNADSASYEWSASHPIAVSKKISSRGLMEPCIVQLSDGALLLEMRGSSTDVTPGRKWVSVSRDGGRSWSAVTDLRYDDGTQFYAPSTFARIIRSTKNGKLYWVGNILPNPPEGNSPRYPLQIAEVDEETASLRKNTVTTIDDYDPQKDTRLLQLSNFSLLENREDHSLEIYLTKYGERGDGQKQQDDFWTADVYKYIITLP